MRKAQKNNVEFFQTETPVNIYGFECFKSSTLKDIRNIEKEDEQFVH